MLTQASKLLLKFSASGKYFGRDSLLSLGNQIVTIGSSIAFLCIITASLAAEQYGQWAYFVSFLNLLLLSALPGSVKASVRGFVAAYPGNYRFLIKCGAVASVVGTSIGIVCAYYVSDNSVLSIFLLAGAILLIPYGVFQQYVTWYVGNGDFKGLAITTFQQRTILLVVCYLPVLVHRNVVAFGLSYLIAMSLSNTWLTYATLRKTQHSDPHEGLGALKYALTMTGLNGALSLADSLQRLVIGALSNFEVLGKFAVAAALVVVIQNAVHSLFVPYSLRLARQDRMVHARCVIRQAPVLLAMGIATYACISGLAVVLIPFAVGEEYRDAWEYFVPLSGVVVFSPLATVLTKGMMVHKYVRFQTTNALIGVCARLIGYCVLAPDYMIAGVAIANVLAATLETALGVGLFSRVSRRHSGEGCGG